MAILPLHLFNAAELPGVPPWRMYPTSDITSYWKIMKAVSNVADHCISRFVAANSSFERTSLTFISETGWQPIGECIFVSCSSSFVQAATDLAAMVRGKTGYWRISVGDCFRCQYEDTQ